MLINMVLPGAAGSAEEPFAFEYSGNYTDNRVDGVGTVTLNTSGTLTVTGSPVTVTATIVGAGGGAKARNIMGTYYGAGGGSGGIQTFEVTLEAGTYDIVIGTGGNPPSAYNVSDSASKGGDTVAFGKTSTGGEGGYLSGSAANSLAGGAGGTPNGNSGATGTGNAAGGSPNGGSVVSNVHYPGGDGYVELTFI